MSKKKGIGAKGEVLLSLVTRGVEVKSEVFRVVSCTRMNSASMEDNNVSLRNGELCRLVNINERIVINNP